jgi:hypothetical protein
VSIPRESTWYIRAENWKEPDTFFFIPSLEDRVIEPPVANPPCPQSVSVRALLVLEKYSKAAFLERLSSAYVARLIVLSFDPVEEVSLHSIMILFVSE